MHRRIELDYNARAPLHPVAREAMQALFDAGGNPSSIHAEGQRARAAIEEARASVSTMIGARSKDLTFTSGATEALHLALHGALIARPGRRAVVTVATEHHAVLDEVRALERRGACMARVIGVSQDGVPDARDWNAALGDDVAAALVMGANNETGVATDVAPLCEAARKAGALAIVDAAQLVGKKGVDVSALGADAVALSGCKIGGPPGIGALWLSSGAQWSPPHAGGSQERGRRPGTENLLGAAGFGAAARSLDVTAGGRVRALRDLMEARLREIDSSVVIHGAGAARLPNTIFAGFPGADAQVLLMLLDQGGVAASSGSACVSGAMKASHVLAAMGVAMPLARGSVRFSLGPATTETDVEDACAILAECLPRSRL